MPSGALQLEPIARSTSEKSESKIAPASVSGLGWARATPGRRKAVVRKVSFIAAFYGKRVGSMQKEERKEGM